MPSIVPPNQTQASEPSARKARLAAWFCTQGDGRKASIRSGSLAVRPQHAIHRRGDLVWLQFAAGPLGTVR